MVLEMLKKSLDIDLYLLTFERNEFLLKFDDTQGMFASCMGVPNQKISFSNKINLDQSLLMSNACTGVHFLYTIIYCFPCISLSKP